MGFPRNLVTLVTLLGAISNNAAVAKSGSAEEFADPARRGEVSIAATNLCLAEHNAERARAGKVALTYNAQLEQAAMNHNNVMVQQNCFKHQCNKEPTPSQRVTTAGYKWSGVAENIAANRANCKEVMSSWMNSVGHKQNIMGNYKHVGCAVKDCKNCDWNRYWTCVFASPM